ncbi:MAG TPA: hypothetical protein VGC47_05395 [Acidimicrobiia bacterium]|jgi:hypothetical protein
MRPERLAVSVVLTLAWLTTAAAFASASSLTTETIWVKDDFDSQGYSGSDGPDSWGPNWEELGESNGPGNGSVGVWSDSPCWDTYCLKIGGPETVVDGFGVYRPIDLGGMDHGKLCFDLRRYILDDDDDEDEEEDVDSLFDPRRGTLYAKISGDGGMSWSTLATFNMPPTDGTALHLMYDIDEYLGEDTVIKFLASGTVDGYWAIDNVEIQAEGDGNVTTTTIARTTTTTIASTTTTTTIASTTTTRPPVTTTTKPPQETTTTTTPHETTTTEPLVTTTTKPPAASTTTQAPESTTTEPPADTTTTTAAPPPSQPPGDPGDPGGGDEVVTNPVEGEMPHMLAGPATGPVDHPGPITQLMATITSSAATLRTHLVPALVLGILLALASVAGIGGREKRVDEQPEA